MERLEDFLFGKSEFWVADAGINFARDWVLKNPRDCRGFAMLREKLIGTHGDPKSPYFSQMSTVLGEMSETHLKAVASAQDIHISPCQYSQSEHLNGPFTEPGVL